MAWIAGTWALYCMILLGLDRWFAKDNFQILYSDHPVLSILAYLLLFAVGPICVTFILLTCVPNWLRVLTTGRRSSDLEEKFSPEREDSVLVDLVRHRALLDPRLANDNVDEWPMCSFWPTCEQLMCRAQGSEMGREPVFLT